MGLSGCCMSEGRFEEYSRKSVTGHLFRLDGSAASTPTPCLISLTYSHCLDLLTLSPLRVKNWCPLTTMIFMSPKHKLLCSPLPRLPSMSEKIWIAFLKVVGWCFPAAPFSKSILVSLFVSVSLLFGKFPLPFFRRLLFTAPRCVTISRFSDGVNSRSNSSRKYRMTP